MIYSRKSHSDWVISVHLVANRITWNKVDYSVSGIKQVTRIHMMKTKTKPMTREMPEMGSVVAMMSHCSGAWRSACLFVGTARTACTSLKGSSSRYTPPLRCRPSHSMRSPDHCGNLSAQICYEGLQNAVVLPNFGVSKVHGANSHGLEKTDPDIRLFGSVVGFGNLDKIYPNGTKANSVGSSLRALLRGSKGPR